jgi:hypothetical protein
MGLRTAERLEDMSQHGALRLHLADDGDIVVVCESEGNTGRVEFCNCGPGGGKSPRTHKALIALYEAMKADNEDHTCNPRRGKRGAGVDAV